MKRRARGLFAMLLASGLLSGVAVGTANFVPCEFEDSTGCTWYGPFQGNGTGDVVINHSDGSYTVIEVTR